MTDLLLTDLRSLHTKIRDAIATRFPALRTVEFYRDEESEDLPTPACLLELDEIEPHEEDPGTGQIIVGLRFSARLIFSREAGHDGLLNVRLAAADVASFINKNRFEGRVAPGRILSCGVDFFRPDLTDRYAIWRVEWHHERAFLGPNVWQDEKLAESLTVYVKGKEVYATKSGGAG